MEHSSSIPLLQAAADIDVVNGLWKGLGYYSRAARLLSGAKKTVAELGGYLPDNAKDMQTKIPGIGRYSAGAICSIAYNEQVPVVSCIASVMSPESDGRPTSLMATSIGCSVECWPYMRHRKARPLLTFCGLEQKSWYEMHRVREISIKL